MQYETVIGLEVHAELSTKTKIFCGCGTAFGAPPNTNCCPVCIGAPGSLPVLNREAVRYAVLAGLALNCNVNSYSVFDRKNYFYPDLPKAYQISQLFYPICQNGNLDIETPEGIKNINIREIHLEEDAGKLLHNPDINNTYIDYNRCGVPLIEIVTEPDFTNTAEVTAFIEKLREILIYLNISDCKMQEGSLRADINLSVRIKGNALLGVRTEMKNMNSLKAISRAIEFESKRQIESLSRGEEIIQESRRWDDVNNKSLPMRSKENAQDYRYFPEPDLPALNLSKDWINEIKKTMPESAVQKRERFINEFFLSPYDANVLTAEKSLCELFEAVTEICKNPKEAASQITGEVIRLMKEYAVPPEEVCNRIAPESFAALINKIAGKSINRTVGKEVLTEIFINQVNPIEYIKSKNLSIIEDNNLIIEAVRFVLETDKQTANDYLSGKEKAFARLMGQAMKQLSGKANPAVLSDVLKNELHSLKQKDNS